MAYVKVCLCQNKEIELSCFGCCGNNFKSNEEIKKDLEKNTNEFALSKSLIEFMNRGKELHESGVCKHLIINEEDHNKIICPGHPKQNEGKEYRLGECNILHECRTSFEFKEWPKQKQARFIKFIKEKNMDSIEFSKKIDNGELLEEFNLKHEN
ncbi:hypothetical protein C0585_02260 [Candidatus Woesearchaeota archaeon]|nr:MAG: hypothetical protein C0585_02260 [Candidatus Woesearchaeota archaeon]